MKTMMILATLGLALGGCNAAGGPGAQTSTALAPMNVSFQWCSGSPEFKVGGIPAATKKLDFRMIDKQAPGYMHGGGSVAFTGKGSASIPCGGLTGGYNGPSPPPPQVHDYEWTVTALDASGAAIAVGRATKKFPQ